MCVHVCIKVIFVFNFIFFSFHFLSSSVADVITPVSGKGPIYSSSFDCTGNDNYLLNCDHGNSTYGSFDHTDDVGVRCYANGKLLIITVL